MAPRHGLMLALWLATAGTAIITASASGTATDGVFARDGHGAPVSWFVVYKLPMLSRVGDATAALAPTPCDCAPPRCAGLPTETLNVTARATGLCYLYADAHNATLRHFRELGYDCLGQGGNDPVSHTLRQIQSAATNASSVAPYWALFNDQLNGIAESVVPPPPSEKEATGSATPQRLCSGSDVFNAHAKGAVAFDGVDGGFVLQTSTPNFPDPSRVGDARADKFIPLGCQKDNNVQFAQHIAGLSLGMETMNALGRQLQAARLCSGNFYGDMKTQLASGKLLQDGAAPASNANFSDLYKALLNASLEEVDSSPTVKMQLRDVGTKRARRSRVFLPVEDNVPLLEVEEADGRAAPPVITVTVKTPRAAVPPWALLAETLGSDMSVATWWDGSYGIPNICAGDVYTNATNHFCLDNAAHGVQLNSNGSAKFNVENLIEASWLLPNTTEKVHWHLVGGSHKDGNHAKWGVSTPRFGSDRNQSRLVTFADLNMEGFPCSTTCHGSQAGRGGSFFTFDQPLLHASFVDSLVTKACPCLPPNASTTPSFEALRMCHMGCWRKVQDHFQPEELPVMASDSTSFWHPTY